MESFFKKLIYKSNEQQDHSLNINSNLYDKKNISLTKDIKFDNGCEYYNSYNSKNNIKCSKKLFKNIIFSLQTTPKDEFYENEFI